MKNKICIVLLILCSGCATYSLVAPGPNDIEGFIISPGQAWNKVPSMALSGATEMWTADGAMLNSLTFFSGVKDGKSLFKGSKSDEYPVFRKDMLPNEIMELVEASIGKYLEVRTSDAQQLRPVSIGGNQGFEFTMNMVGEDNVKRKSYIAGAVKNDALYLLFYQAPAMHYYDKYYQEVSLMVKTATIK